MTVWRSPVTMERQPYSGRRRPYGEIAPHIRGRVFSNGERTRHGDLVWYMAVINANTNAIIASDNTADYQRIADLCDEVTAAARAAWFWSFSRGGVQ